VEEAPLAIAIVLAGIVAVVAIIRIVRRPPRFWLWVITLLLAVAALGFGVAAWVAHSSVDADGVVQESFWLLPVSFLLTGLAIVVGIVALALGRGRLS
jgi:hypothetical protein